MLTFLIKTLLKGVAIMFGYGLSLNQAVNYQMQSRLLGRDPLMPICNGA